MSAEALPSRRSPGAPAGMLLPAPVYPARTSAAGPKESEGVSMKARLRTLSSTGILRPPRQWRPGAEGTVLDPLFGELALRPCGLEPEGGMAPLWNGGGGEMGMVASRRSRCRSGGVSRLGASA
jgi:hypothetical protein